MPLPQQDEFGVTSFQKIVNLCNLSQCRFRSKMNSELSKTALGQCLQVSQCRFRSKMNSEVLLIIINKKITKMVSMPLPQQDEFGD